MPGDKQNNITERLGGLHKLPEGFAFNKDATWQKLEEKLADKPKGKIALWFYAAVAILFFAIAGIYFFKQDENNKNTFVQATEQKRNSKKIIPENAISTTENDAVKPALEKNIKELNSGHFKKTFLQTDSTLNEPQKENELIVIENANTIVADTLKTMADVVIKKPKFKIAHINELSTEDNSVTLSVTQQKPVYAMKKPIFSSVTELPIVGDEKQFIQKKKGFLSIINSSQ
jgi:hypothetical protein